MKARELGNKTFPSWIAITFVALGILTMTTLSVLGQTVQIGTTGKVTERINLPSLRARHLIVP